MSVSDSSTRGNLEEAFAEVGDPVTGEPIGETEDNLKSSVDGETCEHMQMYLAFAKTAREGNVVETAEGARRRLAPRRATRAVAAGDRRPDPTSCGERGGDPTREEPDR